MDEQKRKAMVKAMDLMVSTINDERYIEPWLMNGVADGDIKIDTPLEDIDDYYVKDDNFQQLMSLFLRLMYRARKDGLYCDGILSDTLKEVWQ